MFLFIDSLLRIPEELEQEFRDEVEQYEEVEQMPYVSSIEQLGIKKGRQEGRQEGAAAVILRQLKRRIGEINPELEQQISSLSVEQLEELSEALFDFTDPSALEQWLQTNPSQAD